MPYHHLSPVPAVLVATPLSLEPTRDPDLANQSIVYDWAAGIGSDWPNTAKPELISKLC